MGLFGKFSEGLERSRQKFREHMNVLLDRGPKLDDTFWEGLEETLILSDCGATLASDVVADLRQRSRRLALPDAYSVLEQLKDSLEERFTPAERDFFAEPAIMLFVGINGSGKTTTCGKIARTLHDSGKHVLLGSADTFRAAAIEQLEAWAQRADVEICSRTRGSDPASVCFETIERAEASGADYVLIDTAGRLHTSADLMRELQKVCNVVKKRAHVPVYCILVLDATTGQNGLMQAREFNTALGLDGLIITKLDGSAKGGIALAISHDLSLPILKLGVGEQLSDLKDFDARSYVDGLLGTFNKE